MRFKSLFAHEAAKQGKNEIVKRIGITTVYEPKGIRQREYE